MLKPIIKAQISGKLVTSGISYVAIASVHSEKTRKGDDNDSKKHLLVMKKGDEGMAKRFSKKYGSKG